MQNAIRPNLNDDGSKTISFNSRLLPADVKLQAPLQQDTVAFNKQQAPVQQAQETETTEETTEEQAVVPAQPQQQSLWNKIPTFVKVVGGVAIAAGGVYAYDHFANNGQWMNSIKTYFNNKPQDTKEEGDSIKSITKDFFNTTSAKIQDRIDKIDKKINSLGEDDQQLKDALENEKRRLSNTKNEWDTSKDYFKAKVKDIQQRGMLETEYMEFAREVAEKQEKTPHYNFKKDKVMAAKWEKIQDLFTDHETAAKKLVDKKDTNLMEGIERNFTGLTQRFEYEIKERAKNGTLTKNDIIYINGVSDPNSMFRTMKYDNGKLYDCRKMKDSSLVLLDPKDSTKLVDIEEDFSNVISQYKKAMEKTKVLFEVGSKEQKQLSALEKWSGYDYDVDESTFDPNIYRKKAADLVSLEVLGCSFSHEKQFTNKAYIGEALQDPETKQEFIQKWNESPTLLNISDIRYTAPENRKSWWQVIKHSQNPSNREASLEMKVAGTGEWVSMMHASKFGKNKWDDLLNVSREAMSKKAGYKVGKDGSLIPIDEKSAKRFLGIGNRRLGYAQRKLAK